MSFVMAQGRTIAGPCCPTIPGQQKAEKLIGFGKGDSKQQGVRMLPIMAGSFLVDWLRSWQLLSGRAQKAVGANPARGQHDT